MSLRVGIHENIAFTKAAKNEKGSLELEVKKMKSGNPIDLLNSSTSSTSFQEESQLFLVYPFKNVSFSGEALDIKQIGVEIANVKDPLHHILSLFLPNDKIKWDIMKGTGVTPENYETKMKEQNVLDKVYANIVDQFIAQLTPFLKEKKLFRAVFPRQSKTKYYPSLRKKFLDSYPIFEPMSIPTEQSKIKFTKYELDNGLNVPDAPTGKQEISKDEAELAKSLFN